MFPIFNVNDSMNLVVNVGLATFAATVGYACSRRLSVSDSTRTIMRDESERSIHEEKNETPATSVPPAIHRESSQEFLAQSPSLKRKRTQDDEDEDSYSTAGYPHNLDLIYPPKKRSRTPSSEDDKEEVLAEILPTASSADHVNPEDRSQTPESAPEDSPSPATPPPITPAQSPLIVDQCPSTPPPNVVFGSSATMSSPLLPKSLQPSKRLSASSNAFSAFANASPSFSTASPAASTSLKPAWTEADITKNLNEPQSSDPEEGPSSHVLTAATTLQTSEVKHLTGEENEDVKLEIKGVKLYIKRGDKPYSDGMPGNIKLLKEKSTADERLLFRREPLWQVTVNLRLHPSIRCTFDESENVLRVIVTEPVPGTQKDKEEREVVIYALKPGRSCLKQDFKEFGKAFLESPALKKTTASDVVP